MNRLYLDTNILIDYLLKRESFGESAEQLLTHLAQQNAPAYTSVLNLLHAHYQISKKVDEAESRQVLSDLLILIDPLDTPGSIAATALTAEGCKDFEDAVQWAICQHHGIGFLITRNQKDFPTSGGITVCDAETYLLLHA